MTLTMYWQVQLKRALLKPLLEGSVSRVAVMGIGSSLHGDDAAGIMIARALVQNAFYGERLLVVNAGTAPENKLGVLRRFAPDQVLVIDAAYMGLESGRVRLIDPRKSAGLGFSTHTLPLHVLCTYIDSELGCRVAILGIQPADITLGAALSAPVRESLAAVLAALAEMLFPILDRRAQPEFLSVDRKQAVNSFNFPPENRSFRI